MATKAVNLAVDHQYMNQLDEVVMRCRAAGLIVDQVLKEAGVILGSIDESRIAELQRIEGIVGAEPDRDIRIAPPDSSIQ